MCRLFSLLLLLASSLCVLADDIDVIFQVDMSSEIVSEDGVFLVGATTSFNFDPSNYIEMFDENEDGVYVTTVSFEEETFFNGYVYYLFSNGDTQQGFEELDFSGSSCGGEVWEGASQRKWDWDWVSDEITIEISCFNFCGPCPEQILGCTDPSATNYNSEANLNDGSCLYDIFGCTDPNACDFNPEATTNNGCADYQSCYGCTDINAANYDVSATIDDGGCLYPNIIIQYPTEGQIIYQSNLTVYYSVGDFEIGPTNQNLDGHIHYSINGNSTMQYNDDPIQLSNLSSGTNQLIIELVDNNDQSFNPVLSDTLNFDVVFDLLGCMNPDAGNFNPDATEDDGSCVFNLTVYVDMSSETVSENGVFVMGDFTSWTLTEMSNEGNGVYSYNSSNLTSATYAYKFFNGNGFASDEIVPLECSNFLGERFVEITNTNISLETVCFSSCASCVDIEGCTDVEANNYNSEATIDDGNCEYDVFGCTDPSAFNYDPNANTNDGSCIYLGCTDVTAFNYNSNANTDDGSCVPFVIGCTDLTAFNYDPLANTDDGSCVYNVLGCTNSHADNFNENANIDDGSCVFSLTVNVDMGLESVNEEGVFVFGDFAPYPGEEMIETSENIYTYTFSGLTPNLYNYKFLNGIGFGTDESITGDCTMSGERFVEIEDASLTTDTFCFGECTECVYIFGCINASANNYNPEATIDDNSCQFDIYGCTDPEACNYNQEATISDNSCLEEISITGEVLDVSCNESNNGAIDITVSGGDGNYFYSWSITNSEHPGYQESCGCVASEDISGLAAGIYDISLTDGSGCEASEQFSVLDNICGCTDPIAINYNESATFDDGSCGYSMYGCMDETACNYNPEATENDESCEYPDQYYNCEGECINDADGDDTCDELELFGCVDETACNYNPEATENDESCEYPEQYYNCEGECINDTDGDGACDQLELFGCTDETACNYNPEATEENGSCEYPDDTYYNCEGECINDTDGDGTCDELEVFGCTDEIACNHNPEATENDESCEYPEQYYNCEGECINDADDDGTCDELEVFGCTDETACNYNQEATENDESCEYTVDTYYNCEGECINDTDGDGTCDELEVFGCEDETACNYNPEATENDESCEYPEQYYNCEGECINDTDDDGICDELEVFGCTDEIACNYNPEATENDESCEYDIVYEQDLILCFGENIQIGENIYSEPGFYENSFVGKNGCDSLVFTTLEIYEESSPTISELDGTLSTEEGMTEYQWYLNGEAIGTNHFELDLNISGNYSVEYVDENGCLSAESEDYSYEQVSITDDQNIATISINPNPFSTQTVISFDVQSKIDEIKIIDVSGRLVKRFKNINDNYFVLHKENLKSGLYYVHIHSLNHTKRTKIIIR